MIEFKHDPDCFFTALEFSAWSKVLVLMDTNTQRHCYDLIRDQLPEHHIFAWEPGEANKNINTCMAVWEAMTHASLDRSSLVINLGGGVVCDMGGFCAATFKRGLPFIHCPTSLLAQVDASVGGKLGIDFSGYKNQVGFFQEPLHVFISPFFLKTLPADELRSGHAEMIKHCLIAGGEDWERQLDYAVNGPPSLARIKRSVHIKQHIVDQDAKEKGIRKTLNFGHTIGHAVEGTFLDAGSPILHGHALALGMIAELFLSCRHVGLTRQEMNTACDYLLMAFPRINVHHIDQKTFFKALAQDKKNKAGSIRASLLQSIGSCITDVEITLGSCWDALMFYNDAADVSRY